MMKPKTKDELLAIIAKDKPDFAPGEKMAYSNADYILLGYIVERLAGKLSGRFKRKNHFEARAHEYISRHHEHQCEQKRKFFLLMMEGSQARFGLNSC
jgi:hypothetical protein